jgi:DNA-binding NarL/FixJ family response regulator
VRLLIADDSALLREGLQRLVTEAGHEVIAAVADGPSLDDALRTLDAPDVAILDIRMPPTQTDEGARAALALRASAPSVGILLLSQHIEARYALRLMREHPHGFGYLLKDRVLDLDDLLDALDRVARGGFAVDPEVVAQLLTRSRTGGALGRLTPREQQILALVAQGRSNRAVSAALGLAGKTVENHISSIFAKLDLDDDADEHRRVRAALLYLEQGGPA